MNKFWFCFFPIFMAVNVIGVLPMFMSITEGLDRPKINRIIVQSVVTATVVAVIFLAIGKVILDLLGITVSDFMIAGGTLLFIISLNDLLYIESRWSQIDPESMGAVPLGVPLIVGPAVLTTILILVNEHGPLATVAALIVNILIAGMTFWLYAPIMRLLGKSGARTVSKLAALLLAAIAVMMVRKGVAFLLASSFKIA
ncbi:MAG TPA: MarC family protein [Syntrophales bacterium]|nr:MarC family protein [Syntrophales bacterium]